MVVFLFTITNDHMNIKKNTKEAVEEAAEIIENGGVIICPTDTNYVVMTNIHSEKGVRRIFDMKQREGLKPLSLLLGKADECGMYAHMSEQADLLTKHFWPGPFTVIVNKKSVVPNFVTCSFNTVAMTLFKNEVLKSITNKIGMPVAATSANLSGTGIVSEVGKAIEHLGKAVDLIIDNGESSIQDSNTIVDFTFYQPMLARTGPVSVETLKKFVPDLKSDIGEYKKLLQARIDCIL